MGNHFGLGWDFAAAKSGDCDLDADWNNLVEESELVVADLIPDLSDRTSSVV